VCGLWGVGQCPGDMETYMRSEALQTAFIERVTGTVCKHPSVPAGVLPGATGLQHALSYELLSGSSAELLLVPGPAVAVRAH